MEEYLQYMKTLRSQMNDVEDQAAKVTVQEQMQITTIQTLEKDLNSATSETKKLSNNTDQMMKTKGEICSQILEKRRKIASLESDISTLTQSLELIHQEQINLSAKLVKKSSYYIKVAEDIGTKLKQQQDWVNSKKVGRGQHGLVKDKIDVQYTETEGKFSIDQEVTEAYLENETRRMSLTKLDFAKAKLNEIAQMKSRLAMENSKMKQSIEHVRCRANDFKPELLAMDVKTLEEEQRALLSDKSRETEYLQSLWNQFGKLKGISHVVKCSCGKEYKVEIDVQG